ncbi:hypothetical protein CEE37_01495 [candidate division LCP-89 bacterium B3_LCP]|uniref:Aldehyde oxidase/xanthine dehydrogenase a/b hammerhead domain-containing protein n=1 Tax=candidate division LCP-89 bacterium B3_LCP TaxID=2012998 RepID=A0A532V5H3_UNCL8|nr:MAG: hypothetical protein CEE37_01495 [candidate division LCP-89 bacterium B3_LCP]
MSTETEFSTIGKRVTKPDARDKATGRALYATDLVVPRMLYGKILRSKQIHAKIKNIDTSRAQRLPGVICVITAEDTPKIAYGFGKDNLPLKFGKVRSLMDEVAAVAARTPEIAAEALELIEVEYEPLREVTDPFEALKEDAPLIHEQRADNLSMVFDYVHGNIDQGLDESDHLVEGRFDVQFIAHSCLGPCASIAEWQTDGTLLMKTPTQVPFLYQRDMADVLGIAGSQVCVEQPYIGGGFGSKLDLYPYEVIAALLAKKAARPVKIEYDRQEEFLYSPVRSPMVMDVKTGCTKDGQLTVRVADIWSDNGAYNSWGAVTPLVSMQTASALYRVPHVHFYCRIIYTNNPYGGAMRGFGNPELTFAIEQQIEELAEICGMDPLEFRLLNANQPGETNLAGMKITTCGLSDCLNKSAEEVDYKKRMTEVGSDRGVGIASAIHVGGGARIYPSDGCGVIVRINDFGKVSIISGSTEIGQGSDTILTQIVAEELGVPVDWINVVNTDTDVRPWDVGVHASRTTFIAGNAALKAAREVKEKILETAAEILKEKPGKLTIKNGEIISIENPEKKLPLGKAIRSKHFRQGGSVISGEYYYDPPTVHQDKEWRGNISATYGFGAHAVDVEVDRETGKIKVHKVAAAHDVGRVINPVGAEGQVHGGVAMGLGYALTEQIQLDSGRMLNPNFTDYKIPTTMDIPEVVPIFVETNDPEGPFGAKGMGEITMVPTAAAIANAVYNATGVRIKSLPITPEKVLNALKAKEQK